MQTPDKQQQIIQTHAGLILGVVQCIQNPDLRPQVEQALAVSEQNGWDKLVAAIRKILNGSREESILNGLDDEDSVIVTAILRGLQDPNTLPKPEQTPDATLAAPMLANLINDARRGDHNAVIMLGGMAEQMSMAGGDMASVGAILKDLIDGERDVDKLCDKVGPQGESLIVQILDELGKLEVH
ncbi:MAG: hypothetical protein JSW45_00120 [Thiotrichales bacterium]|nr:MAG: hypothetical protein JSW45_00120 [Thiotrichales bacterium]